MRRPRRFDLPDALTRASLRSADLMELDAFTSRLGLGEGRVQPRAGAGSGEWAFVLGDDEAGRLFELNGGDHAEVVQDTDLTGIDFVRATWRCASPRTFRQRSHGRRSVAEERR